MASSPSRPSPGLLILSALGLFLVWSNSFVAIGYLLGSDRAAPRFDWVGLTAARFLPAALVCAWYAFARHRRESFDLIRVEWPRLLLCGAFAVPAYNLALYYGQEHGVPAPVASLTTALLPLFVMTLAALFLGEGLPRRRVIGFVVAAAGMIVVATARREDARAPYSLLIAVTAIAPLSWSLYSVLSKPVAGRARPLLWTYLSITAGTVLLLPFLPHAAGSLARLDLPGWGALLYLSFPCTVLGFAVWTWLLRHLPASSVGFTVFLNPPLTTLSKFALAVLLPTTFLFTVKAREFVGGGLALLGLVIAVVDLRRLPWSASRR